MISDRIKKYQLYDCEYSSVVDYRRFLAKHIYLPAKCVQDIGEESSSSILKTSRQGNSILSTEPNCTII